MLILSGRCGKVGEKYQYSQQQLSRCQQKIDLQANLKPQLQLSMNASWRHRVSLLEHECSDTEVELEGAGINFQTSRKSLLSCVLRLKGVPENLTNDLEVSCSLYGSSLPVTCQLPDVPCNCMFNK
jgi:hypothetical protein